MGPLLTTAAIFTENGTLLQLTRNATGACGPEINEDDRLINV
jgi:hypothetical protein